ncbi:hypothetical protein B9Z55_028727 [Caenorhabditis nigoni]|nr:hypothetical protein B9Z55_028727 [Caenorhabditis nigoni]
MDKVRRSQKDGSTQTLPERWINTVAAVKMRRKSNWMPPFETALFSRIQIAIFMDSPDKVIQLRLFDKNTFELNKQSPSIDKKVKEDTQLEKTTKPIFTQSPAGNIKSSESRIPSNKQQENSQAIGDMVTHKISPSVDTNDPDWINSKVSAPSELKIKNALPYYIFDTPGLPHALKLQTGKKFIVNGEFGEGVFGIVYFVRGGDNKDYAAKVIKERNRMYLAEQEEEAYKRIAANEHKNLLKLHLMGSLINPPPTCTSKVFITHACGPSLFDLCYNVEKDLKDHQRALFSLKDIRKIGEQVAEAMHHLETLEIYHLDLKMDNIVFAENFDYETEAGPRHTVIKMKGTHVKVIDYGNAKFHPQCGETQDYKLVQPLPFRAPETFLGIPHSVKSDVWSMGCVLMHMYTGEDLFASKSGTTRLEQQQSLFEAVIYTLQVTVPKALLEQSKQGGKCHLDLTFLEYFGQEEEEGIRKLMRRLEDLELFQLLDRMFTLDPSDRPTFYEVKNHEFFRNT